MALSLSLITSFVQTGLNSISADQWPRVTPHVELYAYMDSDLNFIYGEVTSRGNWTNTCDALSSGQCPKQAAKKLHEYFSARSCGIVAICTFLPEIMVIDRPTGQLWKKAVEGLIHLVALARELRKLDKRHKVKVIELVGGSSVGGVWRGKRKGRDADDGDIFVLHRRDPKGSILQLISRLEPVAVAAVADDPVYLALELEPGPLFTIGDFGLVTEFCRTIESDGGCSKAMQQVLGINLDLAHWALLAKIKPEDVRSQPSVLRRITHAHVSGHSKGHFGDIRPTDEMLSIFEVWFNLLKEISNGQHGTPQGPRFSGFVSCELECCRDTAIVADSINDFRRVMDRVCGI